MDEVVIVNSLRLGVYKKYIEQLEDGTIRLPDSLLIIDANDEILGMGDFTPIDQCGTLDPLDVARERAEKALLDGMARGIKGAGELVAITEKDLTPEEIKHIVSGRLPE